MHMEKVCNSLCEGAMSKKLAALEGLEARLLGDGKDGDGEDIQKIREAEAVGWMDRIEQLVDRGGPVAETGLIDVGVARLAAELDMSEADIWAGLTEDRGDRVLAVVLQKALENSDKADVLDWLRDPVDGTDGRLGAVLTPEEAGLGLPETRVTGDGDEVVRGRGGDRHSGGHWWD